MPQIITSSRDVKETGIIFQQKFKCRYLATAYILECGNLGDSG